MATTGCGMLSPRKMVWLLRKEGCMHQKLASHAPYPREVVAASQPPMALNNDYYYHWEPGPGLGMSVGR